MTNFGTIRGVTITVLVDNRANLIVNDHGPVKYFTRQPLLAEHGFSALVQLDEGETTLWDAGITRMALLENMRRMDLDPKRLM